MVLPLLPRVFFLPLGKALHYDLAAHVEATDTVEGVRDAIHIADVAVFIQTEIHQHWQTAILAMEPGVVREPWKSQGEEQRTEEAVRAVLSGDDDEVSAGLLSGQQEVNVMVPGDGVHQFVLKDGQAVAQANGDVAHRFSLAFRNRPWWPLAGCIGGSSAKVRLIS